MTSAIQRRLNRNWQRLTLETRLALRSWGSRSRGTREPEGGKAELIISMTTVKQRLPKAHLTVESLLRQQLKPHRLILWLGEELRSVPLPRVLRRQQQRGLEVRFRPDVGPATKLVHALREHPNAVVATADDDTLYPKSWLRELSTSFGRTPGSIHCYRAHWMTTSPHSALKPYREWDHLAPGIIGPAHRLFPTGVGGVLYPPAALGAEVFNEQAMLKLSPTNDDIWFKAMALLNHVPAMKVHPVFDGFPTLRSAKHTGLTFINIGAEANDRQLRALFEHYNLAGFLEALA